MAAARARAAAAALAILLFAGCLGATVQQGPTTPIDAVGAKSVDPVRVADPGKDFSKIVVANHPEGHEAHAIRSLHPQEPFGMKLVGYHPLATPTKDPLAQGTWFSALDAWDDGTNYYAVITQLGGTGGATIVDITDPAKPVVASQIHSGMANSDAQFTDDGKYLFVGAIAGATYVVGAASNAKPARDALARGPVPWLADTGGSGVSIWDTTDKRNPKFLSYHELSEFHNLFTFTIDGTYYLAQTYRQNLYRFDPANGGKLEAIAKTSSMIHDMTVAKHPLTGDWLLYTGKGRGTAIIDVNDPTNPVDIGEWIPEKLGPHDAKGWHDQEIMAHLVDGRAIAIVAGESLAGSEPYGVIDITDPADPMFLGQWEVPGEPRSPAGSETFFSPHELDTWNGYVVSGNYHAGVWLIDVGSAERLAKPVTLGYFFGPNEPAVQGAPQNGVAPWTPNHWGAYFDSRGYILTADWSSGLYILSFEKTGTFSP